MSVKICPNCGHENDEDATVCQECDYDLIYVVATEKKDAEVDSKSIKSESGQSCQSGRQCSKCNKIKPISMFTCDTCGADLSSAPIVSNRKSHIGITWTLFTCDGQKLLTICEGEEKLIGWEHELADYLNESFSFVGREHAYIGVQMSKAYIIDNNSKNGVQINNQNILIGQRYPLNNGDHISLGDRANTNDKRAAHFIIKQIGG